MIVDFHVHTFPEAISGKVVTKLGRDVAHINPFTDGSMKGLLSSMQEAAIDYSVNLPVMTDPGQVEKINHSFIDSGSELLNQGIIAFGGLHPDYADYKKELRLLKSSGIKGIKLHPAYQNVDLTDIRMQRIIAAATEEDLIITIHAGMDIGLYDHNYSPVDQILTTLKQAAPEKLVLAHMGNWEAWDEVEADLAGAPVYLDTSFSLGPVVRHPDSHDDPAWKLNMSDEQFVRLCRKHGTDRILFATDSPWGDQSDYVNRIRALPFNEEERNLIFGENARTLLALPSDM